MSAVTPVEETLKRRGRPTADTLDRVRTSDLVVSVGLFGLALATQLWAVAQVRFPLNEGSAYYVAVARNLVNGRGFEIDAIWSYATPPLVLPRPAFELWQPLASILAALPMAVLGPTFDAAQLGFALIGALLAPLAWLVARDAAHRLRLPSRRASMVAIGAGALVAVSGPTLLWSAVPDSTLPFGVAAVAACLVMPAAAAGGRAHLVALGLLLGIAYLARLEAVYLGVTFVVLCLLTGSGVRRTAALSGVVALSAALVAAPWWLRNLAAFGTPMPGQLAHNALLTRNEQVFAYTDPPTLDAFLAQGLPALLANIGAALWHNLVDVLIVPGGVVALLGLMALVVLALGTRRSSARSLHGSPLGALSVAGLMTFAVTTVVFPVATLWGTFAHASAPLVVAFIVAAALGADEGVARVRRWRAWPRANAWLAPVALVALTVPVSLSVVTGAAAQAARQEAALETVTASVPAILADAGIDDQAVLIGDRPIWLADALDRPAIALPDEAPADILTLARDFDAAAVIVIDERGRYPDALRGSAAGSCFVELPNSEVGTGAFFMIAEECR